MFCLLVFTSSFFACFVCHNLLLRLLHMTLSPAAVDRQGQTVSSGGCNASLLLPLSLVAVERKWPYTNFKSKIVHVTVKRHHRQPFELFNSYYRFSQRRSVLSLQPETFFFEASAPPLKTPQPIRVKDIDPVKSWCSFLSASLRRDSLCDRLSGVFFSPNRRLFRALSPPAIIEPIHTFTENLSWSFDLLSVKTLFRNSVSATTSARLAFHLFTVVLLFHSTVSSTVLTLAKDDFILELMVSYSLLRLRSEACARRQTFTLQLYHFVDGGVEGIISFINPRVSFMLLGYYGPLCFERVLLVLARISLGLANFIILANLHRLLILDFAGYACLLNLASVADVSFPLRESTTLSGLVQRSFFPVRIISAQRYISYLETFITALLRALIGLFKAVPVWSTSVKCEIAYVEHLDPIEDNLGVHHRRTMFFGDLSFYVSCTFVVRLLFFMFIVWSKTPLKWTF